MSRAHVEESPHRYAGAPGKGSTPYPGARLRVGRCLRPAHGSVLYSRPHDHLVAEEEIDRAADMQPSTRVLPWPLRETPHAHNRVQAPPLRGVHNPRVASAA